MTSVLARLLRWMWSRRLALGAALIFPLLLAVYAFLITGGQWATWPEASRYYDQLASAFGEGHLDLGITAPSTFAGLPDPYDPQAWAGNPEVKAFVDQVWDASFYNGKFYLYFGPAPALLLWLVKRVYQPPLGDQFLVFGFVGGLALFTELLLLRLARRFYAIVPAALVLLGVVVAGLAAPLPWMLSNAAIYEAAIAAGQFFLIAGLYAAFVALDRDTPAPGQLALAGGLWTLAVGSRLAAVIPVAFLTFMTMLWILRRVGRTDAPKTIVQNAVALALPLACGAVALSWYNWARFGSIFETGQRFQLTFTNLHASYSQAFSFSYVLPNLWFYLFNPISLQAKFPFFGLAYRSLPSALDVSNLPLYHLEDIAGAALTVPFLLFAAVAVVGTRLGRGPRRSGASNDPPAEALAWIRLCLIGSSLLSFLALLAYFYVAMRFQADFIPAAVILAALGLWEGYLSVQEKSAARRIYIAVACLLAAISILMSLGLPLAVGFRRYLRLNPKLFRQIQRLFTH